jgi:hypothetical protein
MALAALVGALEL